MENHCEKMSNISQIIDVSKLNFFMLVDIACYKLQNVSKNTKNIRSETQACIK